MKKLFGILVLGLLWCNVGFAEKANLHKLKFSKDITKGYNILRQYGERTKGWYWASSFLKHMRTKPAGDHLLHIVKRSDGYPVRLGEESLKFEVREGDAWASDVEINGVPRNRERSEMIICCMKGKLWHTWSIFLPKDFPNIFPAKTALGQFHNEGDNPVEFQFNNYANRSDPKKSGGYWVLPAETISSHIATKILDQKDMLGKWNDILINSKFTHKKDGFLKVWVNGKLSYEFKGRTHLEKDIIEQEIGIYRSYIHRRPGPEPIQIAYFDEIRFAKSCKKLKIKDLGYSCKEIESQSLK